MLLNSRSHFQETWNFLLPITNDRNAPENNRERRPKMEIRSGIHLPLPLNLQHLTFSVVDSNSIS